MAIDVNIFIQNKKDDIQKALAILEISVSSVEINNFAKKHNLSLSLIEECKSIFNNFERGFINLSKYEKININNYKNYISRDKISLKQMNPLLSGDTDEIIDVIGNMLIPRDKISLKQ